MQGDLHRFSLFRFECEREKKQKTPAQPCSLATVTVIHYGPFSPPPEISEVVGGRQGFLRKCESRFLNRIKQWINVKTERTFLRKSGVGISSSDVFRGGGGSREILAHFSKKVEINIWKTAPLIDTTFDTQTNIQEENKIGHQCGALIDPNHSPRRNTASNRGIS